MSASDIKTTINDIRSYFSTEIKSIMEKVDEMLSILEKLSQEEVGKKCKS